MVEGDEAVTALAADLGRLRRALLWNGVGTENYFHASEDKQALRDAVFQVLSRHPIRVDVTMIEKAKALPRIRTDDPTFFKYAWYYHFKILAQRTIWEGDELMVVTASIGTKKMRAAFQQALRTS